MFRLLSIVYENVVLKRWQQVRMCCLGYSDSLYMKIYSYFVVVTFHPVECDIRCITFYALIFMRLHDVLNDL